MTGGNRWRGKIGDIGEVSDVEKIGVSKDNR